MTGPGNAKKKLISFVFSLSFVPSLSLFRSLSLSFVLSPFVSPFLGSGRYEGGEEVLGDPEGTANIYTANRATFPIRIRKIREQICGNFWVTQ